MANFQWCISGLLLLCVSADCLWRLVHHLLQHVLQQSPCSAGWTPWPGNGSVRIHSVRFYFFLYLAIDFKYETVKTTSETFWIRFELVNNKFNSAPVAVNSYRPLRRVFGLTSRNVEHQSFCIHLWLHSADGCNESVFPWLGVAHCRVWHLLRALKKNVALIAHLLINQTLPSCLETLLFFHYAVIPDEQKPPSGSSCTRSLLLSLTSKSSCALRKGTASLDTNVNTAAEKIKSLLSQLSQ